MPLINLAPTRRMPRRGRARRMRAAAAGLLLGALVSCGGGPVAQAPPPGATPVAQPARTPVHDRPAVVPAAPPARAGGAAAPAQATRAGERAPVAPAVRAAPAAPAAAAAAPAPAPLETQMQTQAQGHTQTQTPASTAPASPTQAPTTEEIWAAERARHRAPRAWYGATAPRPIDCLHLKCIALTFDDGPGGTTYELLDVLARHGARATFFVQGRNVRLHRAALTRAVWEGHEIGNHTWDHRSLVGRSTSDIARDLLRTSDAIARAAGVRPTFVRPPFGATDATTRARVPAPLVLWSVDTDDWKIRDPALVAHAALTKAGPGSVVLLHDVYRESVQAVPAIIDHFQREGYVFVTVTELFGGRLKAGREYHGRELAVARAHEADRRAGKVRQLPPEYAAPSPAEMAAQDDPAARGQFPPAPTEPAPLEPGEVDPQRGTAGPLPEQPGDPPGEGAPGEAETVPPEGVPADQGGPETPDEGGPPPGTPGTEAGTEPSPPEGPPPPGPPRRGG